MATLGLLAGSGSLPPLVAAAAARGGRKVFVVGFIGQTPGDWLEAYPHAWAQLGAVSRILRLLHDADCDEVCLIGKVGRPSLTAIALDRRALAMLTRLGGIDAGDDRLLRLIVSELEGEGFRVVGAHDLAGDLLAPIGPIAGPPPDALARADIRRGVDVARALGRADVGQSVVVQAQIVLGVEAVEGTDHLLERCRALQRPGPGGVLVKGRKLGQERRVDLPTIGPATVTSAAEAGLRGIAIEGGHTLVADGDELARRAERLGLFVLGMDPWA